MKHSIFFLTILVNCLVCLNGYGQSVPVGAFDSPADRFFGLEQAEKQPFRLDLSAYKFTVPLAFVAGFADGFNQTLNFHYDKFKKVFPRANNQFWNPRISWQNKYAIDPNGNVNTNYEAFPFSTSVLVFLTDRHHPTRSVDHAGMYVAVGLNIHDIGNKNWKQILLDIGVTAFARSVGFATTYSIIFAD